MIKQALSYWSKHIILATSAHEAGGAGLVIVLQHYLVGNAFLPVVIGWILLGFSGITHLIALTSKTAVK